MTDTIGFGKPECWEIDIPVKGKYLNHIDILQNWIDAILKGTPLLASGEEGVKGAELANAIYLPSWLNQTVELPIYADLYFGKLQEKMNQSILLTDIGKYLILICRVQYCEKLFILSIT